VSTVSLKASLTIETRCASVYDTCVHAEHTVITIYFKTAYSASLHSLKRIRVIACRMIYERAVTRIWKHQLLSFVLQQQY